MSHERVAFVAFGYPLGVSSMIINSIRMFAQKGHDVDVYTDLSTWNQCPIDFSEKSVRVHTYDDGIVSRALLAKGYRFFRRSAKQLLTYRGLVAKSAPFGACLRLMEPSPRDFVSWLEDRLGKHAYVYVCAIEYASLISLNFLQDKDKIVYFNMELMDWAEKNPLYRSKLFLKNLESRMIGQLAHVAIQSEDRARLFADINRFDPERILILPVASMGEPIRRKGAFFRDLFDIGDDRKIVIYAGNFIPWAQCLETIRTVNDWPPEYHLVMHTWNKAALCGPYFNKMEKEAAGLPVSFSTEYIPYEKMAEALSSADIGLLFYEGIDGNFTEILFSSNKLGEYLKAGLSVVSSDFPSLRKYVEESGIGYAASSMDELPSILEACADRIEEMRETAIACYEREFRFERHFERFYAELTGRRTEEQSLSHSK